MACAHATFRFAVDELGVEAFDNRLGAQPGQFIARDKAHLVAMTGSYFRGDALPALSPDDEARFVNVTYTPI